MKRSNLLLIGVLSLFLTACTTIAPGNIGLKVKLLGEDRGVENVSLVSGRVTYNPASESIIEYPGTAQRFEWFGEESLKFSSTEGIRIGVDTAISLWVSREKAPLLYVKYRQPIDQLIDTVVRDRVNGCLNKVSSTMQVDAIIGEGRTRLMEDTKTCISEKLEPDGFILNDLQFTSDFEVPETIRAKINQQIEAQQEAVAAENRVRQKEAEARQLEAEAEGKKNAAILEAQGIAEAIRIKGASLRDNPEVLRLQYIEKWTGVLPQVVGGDSDVLIPLQDAGQQ